MTNPSGMTDDEIAEVREIFGHYDHDDNGVIDAREFGALLDALEADMTDDEVATGLREVDVNGNGIIEWEEFLRWWVDH